jgi:hypothetical protein
VQVKAGQTHTRLSGQRFNIQRLLITGVNALDGSGYLAELTLAFKRRT